MKLTLHTLAAAFSLAAGATTHGAAAQGFSWPTATPASVGINAAVLDSIDADARSGKYGLIDRFIVIRHGKLVFDRHYTQNYDSVYADSAKVNGPLNSHDLTSPYNYYDPWWHPYYRRGNLHSLQSVTKTVTSAIFGVAITRGDLRSIDVPVLSFFDTTKVANIDDRKRKMTIRNLLSMTAGFDWNETLPYTNPNNSATALEMSGDWVKFTIDRPMALEPGQKFVYNSGASSLLAYVFRRATGMDIEEYASKYVFPALGITEWFWKRSPTGLADTEGGLYLDATDLAKIWWTFSHNGQWNGKQLVSPDWVKQSISPIVKTGTNAASASYGLSWWLYPRASDSTRFYVAGSGFGGQVPVAFPDEEMVIVFNSWNILPGHGSMPLRTNLERLAKAAH